ncbi:MAG: carboxypeptidase-like regulatory domain-containing protein [Clostridia bacterium]|nr:carboxypeptidase-like regulatory domain-containing protein [Clostridia bacterium]
MGYRLVSFTFTPEKNEQIDVVIKVPEEPRSVIQGVVKNYKNEVVKDAVVKLFKERNNNPYDLEPLTHTFTDEYGHFIFGPLRPNQKYVIKVWIGDVMIRQLVINPDEVSIRDEEEKSPVFDSNDYFEIEEES